MFPRRAGRQKQREPSRLRAWHWRGRQHFPSPWHRETEAQSQTGLGESSGPGLHRGCLLGAGSSSGFCSTSRRGGNPQVVERLVCQRGYPQGLSATLPILTQGPPRGTQQLPPPARCSHGAEDPQHPAPGEVRLASRVQAEGRGGEGCRGVLRPAPTCEECRESLGKHPHATSPSASLPAGGQRLDAGFWGEPPHGTPLLHPTWEMQRPAKMLALKGWPSPRRLGAGWGGKARHRPQLRGSQT